MAPDPESPADEQDLPPESTISDGTTASDVEAAEADPDTIVVDLRSPAPDTSEEAPEE